MTALAPQEAPASVDALDHYLRLLAGPSPGTRLLEIRFALRRRGMGRIFIAAHSAPAAGRVIRRLALKTDVYVGVCLRDRRAGGRDAIDQAHLAFVEIDQPDALDRLHAFHVPPTAIVTSGTPGHAHAYFALTTPVDANVLEHTNRQLADALGGDPACVDAARILRPPRSWNHKHSPPAPVTLTQLDPVRRCEVDELVGGLENPPRQPSRPAARSRLIAKTQTDELLLAIPAADYVRALTGQEPNRSGKIHCPFHHDRTASLQLYNDGTWYCYGACHAGGSIFDFASRVFGTEPRGRGFLELRTRLAHELLTPIPTG